MREARLAELITTAKAGNGRTADVWLPELISSAPWQIKLTPHFQFYYYCDTQEDEAFSDTLYTNMERIYSEVADFLPCEQQSSQVAFSNQPRLECFILHTSSTRTFGTTMDKGQIFYLLDPVQDPEYLQRLRHEIMHMLWGIRHGEAPPLFNEGIANFVEHLSAPNADIDVFLQNAPFVLANTPPLAEIADTQVYWEHGSFYTAGGLLVWYLVDRWGWENLERLFAISDYRDSNILDHFYEVYQKDLSTVDIEWRQHLSSLIGR